MALRYKELKENRRRNTQRTILPCQHTFSFRAICRANFFEKVSPGDFGTFALADLQKPLTAMRARYLMVSQRANSALQQENQRALFVARFRDFRLFVRI